MGRTVTRTMLYYTEPEYFYGKLNTMQNYTEFTVFASTPTPTGAVYHFKSDKDMFSWGQDVIVTVTKISNGTRVDVTAETFMEFTMIDFVDDSIDKVFNYLDGR